MSVEVVVEEGSGWDEAALAALAERAVAATLAHLGLPAAGHEVALLGCDDGRIAALNADFRGRARPTNVLSWPAAERAPDRPGAAPAPPDGPELGDIALAHGTVMAEAVAAGLDPDHHVLHLLVHGTLHLLGYDHETEADAELMERLETEILATLGVANPY